MKAEDLKPIKLSNFSEEEKTPLVVHLLEIVHRQNEIIEALRDEIAILKKQKPRPSINPSSLEKGSPEQKKKKRKGKRPGSSKQKKDVTTHETTRIKAPRVPKGSIFKGYSDYVVQDLILRPHNTRYLLECWLTPQGKYITAPLPEAISGHFGSTLTSFILYQHYHLHVTQPLIFEQMTEWGISISKGQINRILTEGKETFHREKEKILEVGLQVSRYVQTDDTGARHAGKNGVATHIGNDLFAWFQSTQSKSRINFLELLRAGHQDYHLNEEAFEYMKQQRLPPFLMTRLTDYQNKTLKDQKEWGSFLEKIGITRSRHKRITTEGALLGSLIFHGVSREMAVLSDDAGQFNILIHALCWIHAERTIHKITPFHEDQRQAVKDVRSQIWDLYQSLKAYKGKPRKRERRRLEKLFDKIFTQKTCFVTLNLALKRLHQNKEELLRVLDRPEIPLHNNGSEGDIRDYVKKRKISGGTRSDLGRKSRDTFMSLKKTCRKLGISFWVYLQDRVSNTNSLPQLSEIILSRAAYAA